MVATLGYAALVLTADEPTPVPVAAEPVASSVAPSPSPGPALAAAPDCASPNKPIVNLTGDLDSDATLGCEREYLLRFETRVNPGVTLTIAPGTVLHGDRETKGLLLVQPGGRLIAEGSPTQPIVFTSDRPASEAKPGDWGGVLLLGRAPTNIEHPRVEGIVRGGEFGGDDPDDDSGVLRYVRIDMRAWSWRPTTSSTA